MVWKLNALALESKRGDLGDWMNFSGFFLIAFVVAGGIAIGAIILFNFEHDFRQAESDILFLKTKNCLEKHEFFDDGFNFFRDCRFNENIMKDRLVYVKPVGDETNEFDKEGIEEPLLQPEAGVEEDKEKPFIDKDGAFVAGVRNYLILCAVNTDEKNTLPRCTNGTMIRDGVSYEIVTASNRHITRRLD